MKFKKGETVIYPQHGACVVMGTKKMEAFGEKREYLILQTVINEMTLKVPVDKTDEVGVRHGAVLLDGENLVVGVVEARAKEVVHASVDDDELLLAVQHAGEQHRGVADDDPARLEHQRGVEAFERLLHGLRPLLQRGHRLVAVADADAPADVST